MVAKTAKARECQTALVQIDGFQCTRGRTLGQRRPRSSESIVLCVWSRRAQRTSRVPSVRATTANAQKDTQNVKHDVGCAMYAQAHNADKSQCRDCLPWYRPATLVPARCVGPWVTAPIHCYIHVYRRYMSTSTPLVAAGALVLTDGSSRSTSLPRLTSPGRSAPNAGILTNQQQKYNSKRLVGQCYL
jgi:hypothetical protein